MRNIFCFPSRSSMDYFAFQSGCILSPRPKQIQNISFQSTKLCFFPFSRDEFIALVAHILNLSTTSWIMAETKDVVKLNLSDEPIPPSHYLGWTNLLCLYLTENLRKMSQKSRRCRDNVLASVDEFPLSHPKFFPICFAKVPLKEVGRCLNIKSIPRQRNKAYYASGRSSWRIRKLSKLF